jgi:hypothetical protein
MRADQDIKSNVPGGRRYSVGITGAATADPTKRYGDGVAVTRTAEGVLKFTFKSHPGYFKGFRWGLGADTPGDVKGHTVTRDTFVAATASADAYIELSVWDSTFAADDLEATEYLDVEFEFSELSI